MAGNGIGLGIVDCEFGGATTTIVFQRGVLKVNLGSAFDVYNEYGTRIGGIGYKESYVLIGLTDVCSVIAFTNGSGVPTVGFTYGGGDYWSRHFHTHNAQGDGVFKTYNRTINFFGYNCAPGTYVAPILFRKCDITGWWASDTEAVAVTLPLTSLSRANTIALKSAVIGGSVVSTPRLAGLSAPDNEYCTTHVTDRGLNCDVEGYW